MEPVAGDPPAAEVERITFVPFLPDGTCALVCGGDRLSLPSGTVRPGEDYLLDTVLRVPLEEAGFRYQRFHPFARDGRHLYAWIEGDVHRGTRPHRAVALAVLPAGEAARRLPPGLAAIVTAATRSYRNQTDESFHADAVRTLQRAYLRATTPEGGSGFSGTPAAWRAARETVCAGVDRSGPNAAAGLRGPNAAAGLRGPNAAAGLRGPNAAAGTDRSGTFLDVGCANGLLMESVRQWCGERGLDVEPFGVDLAPELVALARRRLPHWADRIWVGNAIDWTHRHGQRFDWVHVGLWSVRGPRRAQLVRHHLDHTVAPGGRLLVSHYRAAATTTDPSAAEAITALGFTVAGTAGETAWIDQS